ncbi:hypothetical protein GW7_07995 [Heterocephalus glaber]|uniref:Uncharacterized protein n=1 Tax=Heterocephalus glaber TaxID=10181 RepID=G5BYD9_HETGA|nr:hypothetical protein GW7_07995 [Heterocephalus glaber]
MQASRQSAGLIRGLKPGTSDCFPDLSRPSHLVSTSTTGRKGSNAPSSAVLTYVGSVRGKNPRRKAPSRPDAAVP